MEDNKRSLLNNSNWYNFNTIKLLIATLFFLGCISLYLIWCFQMWWKYSDVSYGYCKLFYLLYLPSPIVLSRSSFNIWNSNTANNSCIFNILNFLFYLSRKYLVIGICMFRTCINTRKCIQVKDYLFGKTSCLARFEGSLLTIPSFFSLSWLMFQPLFSLIQLLLHCQTQLACSLQLLRKIFTWH